MREPLPKQEEVARQARAAADLLQQRLGPLSRAKTYPAATLRQMMGAIDSQQELAGNWDSAGQAYLALAALYNAETDLAPGRRSSAFRAGLKKMAQQLRFPAGFDSAVGFDPVSFAEQLKVLQQQLGK
jgi:hypothetical protein